MSKTEILKLLRTVPTGNVQTNQEILAEALIYIIENKENMRVVCEGCRKLWIEIYSKKVEPIKDKKLRGEVWIEEYHKFIGIFDREKVTFT